MTPPAVPTRRGWLGLGLAGAELAVLTALLAPNRDALSLAGIVLLYLTPVLAAAAIGGARPALAAVVAADLLVNFFFIPPYHTFVVETRDHVITLVVYLLVAAAVSVAVEVAARQRARAVRRGTEAALLARATAEPVSAHSLTRLLQHVRDTFAMAAVALLESGPTGEHPVVTVGVVPPGRPALSAPACGWRPGGRRSSPRTAARSAGWPPPRPACWRRSAWPTRRPAPATSSRSTGSAPRCWPRSATTCVRRWPGSRPPCPACASRTSPSRRRPRRSCWPPSRSPPISWTRWWTTCCR